MVARIPWTMLKPGAFHDHVEDVALIYAAKFRAEAEGEGQWMASVMAFHGTPPEDMISVALVRALRLAAMEIERAVDDGSAPTDRNP